MTAFSRLWKRAPLWRTSLILTAATLAATVFFPTQSLKKHLPWLPGASPSSPLRNTPQNPGTPQTAFQLAQPNPEITQSSSFSVAGHIIPLPAGNWHPLIIARLGPQGEISQQVLARVDRGIVSGIVVITASQQPISPTDIMTLEDPCHDDRNFSSIVTETPISQECSFLGRATMNGVAVSTNPIITAAFNRMATLGFPVPPLMINAGWYLAQGQNSQGVQFMSIDTLIPPIDPTSHQLLAPLPTWDKTVIQTNPDALNFINGMKTWQKDWSNLLRQGFNNTLMPQAIPPKAVTDPSAPKPA